MAGLLGSLAGAGGAPAGPPAPAAAPTGPSLDQKVIGLLTLAIKVLTVYISAEQDQEDKATVAQCLSQLQKVLAKDQAEAKQRAGAGGGGGFPR